MNSDSNITMIGAVIAVIVLFVGGLGAGMLINDGNKETVFIEVPGEDRIIEVPGPVQVVEVPVEPEEPTVEEIFDVYAIDANELPGFALGSALKIIAPGDHATLAGRLNAELKPGNIDWSEIVGIRVTLGDGATALTLIMVGEKLARYLAEASAWNPTTMGWYVDTSGPSTDAYDCIGAISDTADVYTMQVEIALENVKYIWRSY